MANYKTLQKELADVSDLLIALGDEKRQAIIIKLLQEVKSGGLQVSDLTEATNLSRPAVSHHLKVLRQAGIVDYHAEGTKNFYYLKHDVPMVARLQKFLNDARSIMEEKGAN